MEIVELDFAFTFRTLHAHDRIKGGERDTHIARMRGDALLVLAENGVDAIVSVDRAAAAARIAFIARRKRRIVEIITAGSLQKIPTDRGHVTQLWACAGQRLAQNWVA